MDLLNTFEISHQTFLRAASSLQGMYAALTRSSPTLMHQPPTLYQTSLLASPSGVLQKAFRGMYSHPPRQCSIASGQHVPENHSSFPAEVPPARDAQRRQRQRAGFTFHKLKQRRERHFLVTWTMVVMKISINNRGKCRVPVTHIKAGQLHACITQSLVSDVVYD